MAALESNLHDINQFTCRVCLQNGEVCNSFFDTIVCNEEASELRELYKRVTKVEILEDDAKTTQICESCTDRLIAACDFLTTAQRSEHILCMFCENVQKCDEVVSVKEEFLEIENTTVALVEDSEFFTEENENVDSEMHEIELQCEINAAEELENSNEDFVVTGENLQQSEGTEKKELNAIKRDTIGSRLVCPKNSKRREFACNVCQRSFAKMQSCKRHMETAHTYAPREEIAAKLTTEPTIACDFCPRTFMHKNDLQRHVRALHPGNETETSQNETKLKRTYKRGLCPHCGQDFPMASLNIHIRRHLGVNPYKCEICDKGFPRKQDLTIHIRQHSGEKPHVCAVCAKAFIRPNKLARHMRIHLGIRPYKCEECGKSFSQSNDLKIHLRRHSGEKPYICGVCGASFISGTALRVHRKSKSHYEPDLKESDPYENCRVNSRAQIVLKSVEQKMNE